MKIQSPLLSSMLALVILNLPTFAQDSSEIHSSVMVATIPLPSISPVAPATPIPLANSVPTVRAKVAPTHGSKLVEPGSAGVPPAPTHGSHFIPIYNLVIPANSFSAPQTPSVSSPASYSAAHTVAVPTILTPSLFTPTQIPNPNKRRTTAASKKQIRKELLPRIISQARSESNNPDEKCVALTFDDGPSPEYTPQILALLKENGIHATFCVVGRQVKKCPELLKQMVAEGHLIADHSMNHDERLPWRNDQKIQQEILGEKTLIESIVPETTFEYYRAPGGVWSAHLRKMLEGWGMKALGWSVDTKDWQKPGVDAIVNNVKNNLQNGGVVLMHDGGGDRSESVAALKQIIPYLKQSGYHFSFPQ